MREQDEEWLKPPDPQDRRRGRVIGTARGPASRPQESRTDAERPRTIEGSWDVCPCGGTGLLIVNAGGTKPCPTHGKDAVRD